LWQLTFDSQYKICWRTASYESQPVFQHLLTGLKSWQLSLGRKKLLTLLIDFNRRSQTEIKPRFDELQQCRVRVYLSCELSLLRSPLDQPKPGLSGLGNERHRHRVSLKTSGFSAKKRRFCVVARSAPDV
jgi:hypothetical protein